MSTNEDIINNLSYRIGRKRTELQSEIEYPSLTLMPATTVSRSSNGKWWR